MKNILIIFKMLRQINSDKINLSCIWIINSNKLQFIRIIMKIPNDQAIIYNFLK